MIETTHRSKETEMMDDLEMRGELLGRTLDRLARINRQLGGTRVTLSAVQKLLKDHPQSKEVTVFDVGCGDGGMLRALAHWGRKAGRRFKLIGIDANKYTINHARACSADYPEISFQQQEMLSDEIGKTGYDIALATLFLHHFKDKQIESILADMATKARLGIVVNDLQRSRIAYFLFKIYCLSVRNHMIRHDGLISILRAFRRTDLERFSTNLGLNSEIHWRWAFRYQWIIRTK